METQPETTPAVTTRSVGIKWGLISAIISIVFFLILALVGTNAFDNKWSWIGMIVSVVLVFLAHKNFKDSGDGYMSYGQGVAIGFWIALISLALAVLVQFTYVNFIDTGVMEMFFDAQIEEMSKKGMPDNQIDVAIEWTKKLFWVFYILGGLFFGVLVGVVVSLFTQKKNPQPAF